MTVEKGGRTRGWNPYYLAGAVWLVLSAWAFGTYYAESAPFDNPGIPVSQLVLGIICIWVG